MKTETGKSIVLPLSMFPSNEHPEIGQEIPVTGLSDITEGGFSAPATLIVRIDEIMDDRVVGTITGIKKQS